MSDEIHERLTVIHSDVQRLEAKFDQLLGDNADGLFPRLNRLEVRHQNVFVSLWVWIVAGLTVFFTMFLPSYFREQK